MKSIKAPKRIRERIQDGSLDRDEDGWWALLRDGLHNGGAQIVREDTKRELFDTIMAAEEGQPF